MKKNAFLMLFGIASLTISIHAVAQTTQTTVPANTTATQVPATFPSVTFTPDFLISVPSDQPIAKEYLLRPGTVIFTSPEAEESYFTSLSNDYVTYRVNKTTGYVWVVPNQAQIKKSKWETADFNTYLAGQSSDMHTRYVALQPAPAPVETTTPPMPDKQ